MRVVHEPPVKHVCRPGVTRREIRDDFGLLRKGTVALVPPCPWDYPRGTVVECDCGKTHVSLGAVYDHAPGRCYFRPEGKFERWRRERRQARV